MKYAIVAVVAVLFFVVTGAQQGCRDYEKAEQAAADYAKNITGATGRVSCVKMDSDGDGYVSCSVFMEKGQPLPIECTIVWWHGGGCKAALPKMRAVR